MKYCMTIFSLILTLLTGCTTEPTPSAHKSIESCSTQEPKSKNIDTPKWLLNPDVDNNIGVIGYARAHKNYKQQKKTAIIVAKARMSERLHVKIDDMVFISSNAKQNMHTKSVQTSNTMIKNMYLHDEYLDKSGVLYVWLTTKKGTP